MLAGWPDHLHLHPYSAPAAGPWPLRVLSAAPCPSVLGLTPEEMAPGISQMYMVTEDFTVLVRETYQPGGPC